MAERWDVPSDVDAPRRWRTPRLVDVTLDLWDGADPENHAAAGMIFSTMEQAHRHTFILSTAHPARVLPFCEDYLTTQAPGETRTQVEWPSNVWLLVRVSTQTEADTMVPQALKIPAAVRGIDLQPREAVDLRRWICRHTWTMHGRESRCVNCDITGGAQVDQPRLSWIRITGEIGLFDPTPLDLTLVRAVLEQAKAADVPVWIDRLGSHPVGTLRDLTPHLIAAGVPVPEGGPARALKLRSTTGSNPLEWPKDLAAARELPQ